VQAAAPILALAALAVFLAAPLGASAGQPVKLTLWSGYPEMKPYFEAAARFYNELRPNVTIEVSTFPLRDIERKYAVSLPTNSGPDIAESHIYIAQMHIENGSLVPNPAEVTKFLKSGVFHPLFVSDSTGKTRCTAYRSCLAWTACSTTPRCSRKPVSRPRPQELGRDDQHGQETDEV